METGRPLRFAIRTAVPHRRVAQSWGDHHFACAMADAFSALGHRAQVECRDERSDLPRDVVLTVRGRVPARVDPGAVNLLWIISHPERVTAEELRAHDHVFVASHAYAAWLAEQTDTPVSVLLQATDPARFRPLDADLLAGAGDLAPVRDKVLFVGNSRKAYRTMVRHAIRARIDLAVYGAQWERIIPARYIQGTHVPNASLAAYYGSCSVLLNDHWDSMAQHGFISNRLYDASACGAFVLSDPVEGFARVFPGSHECVASARELADRLAYYLAHPEERRRRAQLARTQVLAAHTFRHRAIEVVEVSRTLLPVALERRQKRRLWAAWPAPDAGQLLASLKSHSLRIATTVGRLGGVA